MERQGRQFKDFWRRFREDPNEETVAGASNISGLSKPLIRDRLRKGRARVRKIPLGRQAYWVVEMNSLSPHRCRGGLPASSAGNQIQSRENRSRPRTHLGRARERAGLGDEWLTTRQAADHLGAKSPSTIRHRIAKGTLRVRRIGRSWLVKKEDLEPLRYSR